MDDLNQRKIGLMFLTGTEAKIDTTTSNGQLVFCIFAALAEFEPDLIRERTKAGLAARARGRLRWTAHDNDTGDFTDGYGCNV